jgi:hypothetical protein
MQAASQTGVIAMPIPLLLNRVICLHTLAPVRNVAIFAAMPSRAALKSKRRRTTTVPVTTMEEIPVLSDEERAQLMTRLKDAEKRILWTRTFAR